jgi:hypothetical protein
MKRLSVTLLILVFALAFALPCLAETAEAPAETAAPEEVTAPAEAEDAAGSWFTTSLLTEKLAAVQWYTWLVVLALAVLGIALFRAGKAQWNAKILAYAAMTVAISFVLSTLRLYKNPQGGSVTLFSMLPVIAFSLAFGPARGALVGCAYGFLQLLYDPFVIHPLQMLVDYRWPSRRWHWAALPKKRRCPSIGSFRWRSCSAAWGAT